MKPDRARATVARLREQVAGVYATRDAAIVERIRAGETMTSIAADYLLTRQRVSQIAQAGGLQPRRWTRR